VTPLSPALAVLDGLLCKLTREGTRAATHLPLATAVIEFCPGSMCVYVREHPYGLLPGIPNLYCLDGDLRLQWMAEWPEPADACARILGESAGVLVVESCSGVVVRLDARDGRLLAVEYPLGATG
jgi:hypothetical protein